MLAKVLFHQRFHENRDTPYTPYFHLKLEHSSIETGDDWGLAHGFPMDFLSISDQPILPYRRAMTMVVSKNQEKSLLEIINRQGMPHFFGCNTEGDSLLNSLTSLLTSVNVIETAVVAF